MRDTRLADRNSPNQSVFETVAAAFAGVDDVADHDDAIPCTPGGSRNEHSLSSSHTRDNRKYTRSLSPMATTPSNRAPAATAKFPLVPG
jgi:hypothetical protein